MGFKLYIKVSVNRTFKHHRHISPGYKEVKGQYNDRLIPINVNV